MYLNDNYDHFYEATTLSAPTTPRTLKSVQEENHGLNSLPVPEEEHEETPTNQRSAIEEIRDFHIEWQKVQGGGTCHLVTVYFTVADPAAGQVRDRETGNLLQPALAASFL